MVFTFFNKIAAISQIINYFCNYGINETFISSKKNCEDDCDNHGCHLLCKDVCEIDKDFTLTTPAAPTQTTTYAMLLPQ